MKVQAINYSLGTKKRVLDEFGFTKAHKMGFTGQGVKVGVNDLGIFSAHPAFGDKVKGIYKDYELQELAHGNLVVGEIAAQPSYNDSFYGAAYGAEIIASSTSLLNSGNLIENQPVYLDTERLKLLVDSKARIINCSHGPDGLFKLVHSSENRALLQELFEINDAILVVAAGNEQFVLGTSLGKWLFSGEDRKFLEEFGDHIVWAGALVKLNNNRREYFEQTKKELNGATLLKCGDAKLINMVKLGKILNIMQEPMDDLIDTVINFKNINKTEPEMPLVDNDDESLIASDDESLSLTTASSIASDDELSVADDEVSVVSDYELMVSKTISILQKWGEKTDKLQLKKFFDTIVESLSNNEVFLTQSLDIMGYHNALDRGVCNKYKSPIFDKNQKWCIDVSYSNIAGGFYKSTIFAPGTRVLSTEDKGTSMAAPLVSSALALLLQQHPEFSSKEAIQKLFASADKMTGCEYWYGQGILNVERLLGLDDITIPEASEIVLTGCDNALSGAETSIDFF